MKKFALLSTLPLLLATASTPAVGCSCIFVPLEERVDASPRIAVVRIDGERARGQFSYSVVEVLKGPPVSKAFIGRGLRSEWGTSCELSPKTGQELVLFFDFDRTPVLSPCDAPYTPANDVRSAVADSQSDRRITSL